MTTLTKLPPLVVGDKVTRWLAGTVPMPLTVTEIKEDRYVCAMWEFDKEVGMEIDDYLQWGPKFGATGSYIIKDMS
jgi:hypothetical protein